MGCSIKTGKKIIVKSFRKTYCKYYTILFIYENDNKKIR